MFGKMKIIYFSTQAQPSQAELDELALSLGCLLVVWLVGCHALSKLTKPYGTLTYGAKVVG